jgi:hypothetical protein
MEGLPKFNHWGNPHLRELADLCARVAAHLDAQRYRLDSPLAARLRPLGLQPAADRPGVQRCVAELCNSLNTLALHALRNSLSLDELLHPSEYPVLLAAARRHTGGAFPSLLESLGEGLLERMPTDFRQGYPLLASLAILEAEPAQALALDLLTALDWYGQYPEQSAAAPVTCQLLLKTLALDLDPEANLRRFDFSLAPLRGLSFTAIRRAVDDHVRDARPRDAAQARPLIACLLSAHLPVEFQVPDVPGELAWRRSNSWVHFSQGVSLAEAIEPGSAVRLGFVALCGYASALQRQPGAELPLLLASSLAQAIGQWGIGNGLTSATTLMALDDADIQRLFAVFIEEEQQLASASEQLAQRPPERLAMAREALAERGVDPAERFYEVNGYPIWEGFWRLQLPAGNARFTTALSAVAAGRAGGLQPAWTPAYRQGHDGAYYPPLMAPFEDIDSLFETRFGTWRQASQAAAATVIEALLHDLPTEQRQPLEHGAVSLLLLRRFEVSAWELAFALGGLLYRELVDRAAPLQGHCAFMLRATYQGRDFFYEVFPYLGLIRLRDEITELPLYDPQARVDRNARWRLPLDAEAYFAPAAPRAVESGTVMLEQLGAPFDAARKPFSELARWLARRAAREILFLHAERLRWQCRGQTSFDQPSPWVFAAQLLVPFWKPLQDWREGIARGDRSSLRWAALGLVADAAALLQPAVKLIGLGARAAGVGMRLGLHASLPSLRLLANQSLLSVAETFNPAGLVLVLVAAPRWVGQQARRLARALRQARRRPPVKPRSAQPLHRLPGEAFVRGSPQQRVKRLEDGQAAIVQRAPTDPGQPASHFLLDSYSGQPAGRALARIDDKGRLSRRHLGDQPMAFDSASGHWLLADTTPGLTKHWTTWGDELYLQAGGVTYRCSLLPDGGAVLRRVHSSHLQRRLGRLANSHCRQRRGLDLVACAGGVRNLDHTGAPAPRAQGVDAVNWFGDRSITPARDGRLVHNQYLCTVVGGDLVFNHPLSRSSYRREVTAKVIGGNDRFKQIQIDGGLVEGVADSRRISAVVATRKNGQGAVLITRGDDRAYYRGEWRPEQAELTLTRIRADPPSDLSARTTLGEDDALQYIYIGSQDANRLLATTSHSEVRRNLRNIGRQLGAAERQWMNAFIGGPFELGTLPEEAALFCRFTQRRLVLAARSAGAPWASITADTPHALRSRVAADLNALHGGQGGFSADNLPLPATTRRMASGGKNLAYARVRFKDPEQPERVYYSLSGLRRAELDLPLTRQVLSGALDEWPGWRLDAGQAVAADGTRYINAQFRPGRHGNPPADELLYLPDLASLRSLDGPSTQRRMLDSERMLLASLRRDLGDFSTVDEVLVFSMKPTCQSCTMGLAGLRNKLASGKFQVLEGAV